MVRSGFEQIVANAFAGFGFPAEAPVTYIWPTEMFTDGSDLSPIDEHIDEFLEGLTSWEAETKELGIYDPDMITVNGSDYFDAFTTMNNLFIRDQWSDTLPLIPPTEEYVDWIMTGTDKDADEIVSGESGMLPRGGVATVRTVATNLAMAGGRPEHLPFLIAAVEAMCADDANMQNWNATTHSTVPAFIINGQGGRDIRLGSGYGLLGPDPLHPASQILGRAVRLLLQNVSGATPGVGSMAIFGGMRETNAFFAEDEEGLPEGWNSFAVDRGYSSDQTVLTLTVTNSMVNLTWNFGDETVNEQALLMMSGIMAAPNRNRWSHQQSVTVENKNLDSGICLMPRTFADSMKTVSGYSKEDVKQFLWDHSQISYDTVETYGFTDNVKKCEMYADFKEGDMLPVTPIPDQITIVVAGGEQGGHGYWMGPIPQGEMVSVEVDLPSNWDDLLYDAEIDLGAKPTTN